MHHVVYRDSEQLYAILSELFNEIGKASPDAQETIRQTRMNFTLMLRNPDAVVSIKGKENPVVIEFNKDPHNADIEVEIPAHLYHFIMLGKLPLKKIFMSGDVKIKGPFWKALKLESIFHSGQKIYPEIARKHNLEI